MLTVFTRALLEHARRRRKRIRSAVVLRSTVMKKSGLFTPRLLFFADNGLCSWPRETTEAHRSETVTFLPLAVGNNWSAEDNEKKKKKKMKKRKKEKKKERKKMKKKEKKRGKRRRRWGRGQEKRGAEVGGGGGGGGFFFFLSQLSV